eukprot:scaffold21625_cov167-Amphora_coffeaeformis.AAC.2
MWPQGGSEQGIDRQKDIGRRQAGANDEQIGKETAGKEAQTHQLDPQRQWGVDFYPRHGGVLRLLVRDSLDVIYIDSSLRVLRNDDHQ